jgi:F-type H+-transporting ATPase subunit f
MARIAKFYERLPKGPAPELKPSGLLGRYQAKYFGKEPSAARECTMDWYGMNVGPNEQNFSYLARHLRIDGPGLWHGVLLPLE